MARISKAQVEQLAREVSVERLVEERGIALVSEGAGLVGACPWCDADSGLRIDRAANTFLCSCGKTGGPVEWVVAIEGVSLTHAVELLREGLPLSGPASAAGPPKIGTRRLLAGLPVGLPDDALLAEVVAHYHRTLLEAPEAAVFLERRGLGDSAMVEQFRLGFSNRTLGLRVDDSHRVDGKSLRPQLRSLGVFSPDTGHEAYRGSLTVPVFDVEGRVVQLYGRKINRHHKPGTEHTWLASPARPLFNPAALVSSDQVIIAGSILDALSWWRAGFGHVVAVDGPEGFDGSHLDLLVGHEVTSVLVGFRRDDAGEAGAAAVAKRALAAGVQCYRLVFPAGMDANDLLRASKHPTDALAQVLRGAVWCGKGPAPGVRHAPAPTAAPDPPPAAEPEQQHTAAADNSPDESVHDVDDAEPEPVAGDDDVAVDRGEVWASPTPAGPADEPGVVYDGDAMRMQFGERRWRVRNLEKNTSFDVLRVQVVVSVPATPRGPGFHMDNLDLYSARARGTFVRDAAIEVGVDAKILKDDLGKVLWAAESIVEEAIRQAQTPAPTRVELDPDERAAALELLQDPKLVDRVTADFAKAGMVGESTNCLVGFLAAVSRKLERPLAVMVQSTSAAGKSTLMDAVLDFVPDEDRVAFSAMTGQALFYMGEHDLAHKVLAIAEEEGAERASYPLKLLQSEGQLTIASTGKDTSTGRLVAQPYHVEGPAAILMTTTAIDLDEELLNRCIVLTVDEDPAQTRAIHERQRRSRTLEGLLAANERAGILKRHQDAQRLLEPVAVVNPFADRLGFADGSTRTRRDHVKYLTLIEVIALLHQHQRTHHTATTAEGRTVCYIEATLDDIALANTLAHEVLGRSLDELSPPTRRVLDALDVMVGAIATEQEIGRDRVRFTRRQVRERTGFGDTQTKTHLARLVDLEFVWCHRGERSGGFVYELAWDGSTSDRRRFLPGLVDVSALRNRPNNGTDDTATTTEGDVDATAMTAGRSGRNGARSGRNGGRSAPGRVLRPGRSGPGRAGGNGTKPQANGHKPARDQVNGQKRASGGNGNKARGPSGGVIPEAGAEPDTGKNGGNGAGS